MNGFLAVALGGAIGACLRHGAGLLAARHLAPDLIKIDVEGAEVRVLQGACEIMRRYRPVVFLSVHPDRIEAMGSSVEELGALIESLGYRAFEIAGAPVSTFHFAEYVLRPGDASV